MAGDRQAYKSYMEAGHNAAWDQDWQAAIKAYTAAAREFSEDPEAHIHLGLSLMRANRLDEALKVYSRANQLAPDDPIPLEKSADILERVGRLQEAAQQYMKVSEIYLGMRDLVKAIGNWERATQLTPGLVAIHAKLAQAYERVGDKRKAIQQYLTLAFNFKREGDTGKAMKAVERALRLDKNNAQALNIMSALKSGADINPIQFEQDEPTPRSRRDEEDDFDFGFSESDRSSVGDADPLGPMGEAMNAALGMLAAFVVESGALDASGADALQAMEFQRQERYDEAVAAYQRAEERLRHPALELNLGVLMLLNDQPYEAIKHLGEAMTDGQLSSGAMHALGIAYHKSGKQKQASRYLIQSLQAVDAELAVSDEERNELQSVYDRLFTALDGTTDEAMNAINERFVRLLSGTDWKQRVADTRRHLDEIMRTGGAGGVRDFLGTSGTDELTDIVGQIDRYIRQGYYVLAMDEAHRSVEYSPFYLPVHVRMAEILMREGRVRQAINKYNMVARSYIVRDESERAASILTEVLEMAPLDISVRASLIELLENEKRWHEVLDQYIDLARTYNQLGNFDMARETYMKAEALSAKIEAPPERIVVIKHAIADLDQMRLDMRHAQQVYEQIITIMPNDERAYRRLIELYYNQGNQVEATARLDKLLGMFAKDRQVGKIVQVLEGLVRNYPKDSGLRSRLGGIYRQLGRKEDAIEQYDALGELQLEAGLHKDAVNTIKQIIKLEPSNVEDYHRLLSQLGSQG